MKNRYTTHKAIGLSSMLLISCMTGCDAPTDPSEDAVNQTSVQPQGVPSSSSAAGNNVFSEPSSSSSATPVATSSSSVVLPPQSSSSSSQQISVPAAVSSVSSSVSSAALIVSSSSAVSVSSEISSSAQSISETSSVASSVSSAGFSAELGKSQFQANCNGCHLDNEDGTFGGNSFNVNSFTYPSKSKYQGHSATSVETLAAFLEANMQGYKGCVGQCSENVAAYLWSYRGQAQPPHNPVSIKRAEFTDQSISLELDCADNNMPVDVQVTGSGPLFNINNFGRFEAVTANAGQLTAVAKDAIASVAGDKVNLTGSGIDIWADQIFFNALKLNTTSTLDIGLTVHEVQNVAHAYAKLGILASSTTDLSGDLVFVHWSGENGLAVDTGTGSLTSYSQLSENTSDGTTSTPATLRLSADNGSIEIGACFGCAKPELASANLSFKPKALFIVASSHDTTSFTSSLSLHDYQYSEAASLSQSVECIDDIATVGFDSDQLALETSVNIQVFADGNEDDSVEVERVITASSESSSAPSSAPAVSSTPSSSSAAPESSSSSSSSISSQESSSEEASSSSSSSISEVDYTLAPELYAAQCSGCHGSAINSDLKECDVCGDQTALFNEILTTMPLANAGQCDAECSEILAHYIYNDFFADLTPPPSELELSCEDQEDLMEPILRRLSASEYKASVESIFGAQFNASVWPDFNDGLPTLGMSNNADLLNIDAQNFQSIYASVDAIVDTLLVQNSDVTNCLDSASSGCIADLISDYAPLVWRRPLSDSEQASLLSSAQAIKDQGGSIVDQAEFTFKALLLSRNFLFRYEIGESNGDISMLSAYEVASVLSYALWGTPPDAELYELAAEGSLTHPEVIAEQVDRMIASAKFSDTLLQFYKDFFKLDRVLTVAKLDDLQMTDEKRAALLESAEASLTDQLSNLDLTITEVLDFKKFYVNDLTASIFGVEPSDYSSELKAADLPSNERNGLLTHPAFLTAHSKEGNSGIVKRGIFNLLQLMCLDLGDPPEVLTESELPPEIDPAVTSSRDLLRLRHSAQPECNICHKKIDPAGFGYENYDAIGQFRTIEKDVVPIDASGELISGNDVISFENNIEFTDGLMASPTVKACMTQRYVEYLSGQALKQESCEMRKLTSSLNNKETQSLKEIIKSISTLESLRVRGTK